MKERAYGLEIDGELKMVPLPKFAAAIMRAVDQSQTEAIERGRKEAEERAREKVAEENRTRMLRGLKLKEYKPKKR